MKVFGVDRLSLRHAMDILGHQSDNLDEPIITALIVNKQTGRCSVGIAKEFNVRDDDGERKRLYAYWNHTENEPTKEVDDSLETRAARFASVEIVLLRPHFVGSYSKPTAADARSLVAT